LHSADVVMADGTPAMLGERSTLDNSLVSKLYASVLEIREKYVDAITQSWPRTWRNSAGYRLNYLLPWSPSKPSQWDGDYPPTPPSKLNLASLLAGSEGTLAIISRAKVKLVPKPKHTILAVLSYQSIADACDDVPRLLLHHPSAVELIPRFIIQQARGVPEYARQMGWVIGDPAAILVVEFSGDQLSALKDAALKIGEILTFAESREDQARIWNVRKVGLGLLDSRPGSARPVAFIEDCAIPVDKLGGFVREIEKILAAHRAEGGIYAHASGGCLHIRPILDLKTGEGIRSMRSIAEATLKLTLSLGGSMSSEHGDGMARGEWLKQIYGDDVVQAMNMLKQAADPDHLLNPKKMFDAPQMDSNLRYTENSQAQIWVPVLDFSRNGSLVTAIEQCNGQGVCRKDTGVMCPSYQATREEMHSTRGRANLLRSLIKQHTSWNKDSVLRNKELTESVATALDLCLACKGCKAECPSGVDMAKLKYEFENQYYKTHRRPLRDYVFGYFDVVAQLASQVAPLSNALMQNELFKNMTAKILGITSQRPFPKFTNRRAELITTESHRHGEKIIFFSDPFSRYIEPQVEQAAFDVLSACGYDVRVVPIIGAGASLLSKGFLEAAKRHAGKILDALNQLDPQHEAVIVGIEPPEIYMFKHDYLDLIPERKDEIGSRVARTWLLDEYLLRSDKFSDLRVGTSGLQGYPEKEKQKIKFQPHCHQRAEGVAIDGVPSGTNATVELLQLCGYDVEVIEAGCCGMAGTFGYEAEHYQLSIKVGELKLFPKLREWRIENSGVKCVSTGAACRMQIRQGTGVDAVHPILFVWQALSGG
jgi:Fe-S oxidoreductase